MQLAPKNRLQICLVAATFIVAGLLTLVRLPEALPPAAAPLLFVDIVADFVEEVVEDSEEPLEPLEPLEPEEAAAEVVEAQPTEAPASVQRESIDWHAEIVSVVAEMSLPSEEKAVFNVAQQEERRRAAEQFAPIPSHEPVPVWDNVIKDMTGRSVLQHGDCQRVINDPNASTREAFETFGQYIVTCSHFKEKPKKLAWVSEVESRRAGPSRYGRPVAE